MFQCRGCNPSSRDQNGRDAALTILKTAGFAEERKHSAKTRQRRKPDMIHVYRDPTGKPYHRVYRRGSGPDKKVWQDAGYEGSLYPYRVEQLPDRSDVPIIIVEGERCADHLVRLEYAAVTWCGGAGQETDTKWGALAGHPVILWPDNDASGTSQGAMRRLAHILDGLGCDLQLVSIPEGKPDKWDAADATDEEIHGLIEEAKPIGGADEFAPSIGWGEGRIQNGMHGMSMAELLAMPNDAPNWLHQDVLPSGGLSLLAGKPKTGKSTVARSLAFSVARGDSFLSKATMQGTIYYAAFEERPASVRDHFVAMGATCQRRSKSTPLAGVKMHHLMRFSPPGQPWAGLSGFWGFPSFLALVETVAVAVHLQDMNVVCEPVQQRPSQALGTEHLGPLIER